MKITFDIQKESENKQDFRQALDAYASERLVVRDNGNTAVASILGAFQTLVNSVRSKHNKFIKDNPTEAEKLGMRVYSHSDACLAFARQEKPIQILVDQLRRIGQNVARAVTYTGYLSDDDCEIALAFAGERWIDANPLVKAQLEAEQTNEKGKVEKKAA